MRCAATMLLLLALAGCGPKRSQRIVIGSKNFTEQLVLGELFAQYLHAKTGLPVERRFYLAGTYICQQAILSGRLDIYPEYTGTALTTILNQKAGGTPQQIY
ncbi:MAG: glycine betaine ABC transporter substrate-binding protein, partial [Terriglobia bacterium]